MGGSYTDLPRDTCYINHIGYHYNCGPDPIACCMVIGSNLTGSLTDNAIDSSGLLVNRALVGTVGHEIAESEYYVSGDGGTPAGSSGISCSGCGGSGW
jgi:hypothetical protein